MARLVAVALSVLALSLTGCHGTTESRNLDQGTRWQSKICGSPHTGWAHVGAVSENHGGWRVRIEVWQRHVGFYPAWDTSGIGQIPIKELPTTRSCVKLRYTSIGDDAIIRWREGVS